MIVVFGAIGVDIVANVERIPRPGETMLSEYYSVVPGTKGANQALAAARAGSKVVHVGTCGQDSFGEVALLLLQESNIDLSYVVRSTLPTGVCLVTVDANGENTVVAASAANLETVSGQMEACDFNSKDIVVVQNEVRQDETYRAIRFAKDRKATVVFNVAPAGSVPKETLSAIDVLIVNEHEVEAVARGVDIVGRDLSSLSEILSDTYDMSVIVTLGAKGAIAWRKGSFHQFDALPVDVVDTTAAGDSFTGAFAASMDQGVSFTQSIMRGIIAGSLSVTKKGAQPSIPFKSDIDKVVGFPS